MQLGWPWGRKQREPALDTVPLKKIVAVSDEYWEALYSPITNTVSRSLGVYEKQKGKLYSDYVDQFVRLVRRSKGTVQDDPLIVHLHTFSLALAFSSLYVARLCHSFEFTAISTSKKNKGERSQCYPWINVPSECEIKLAKVSRLYPAYVQAISIFNTMMNETGWKWLHSRPEVLKGLLDSVYTNGEKGAFAGILSDMRSAPIGRSVESAIQTELPESSSVDVEQEGANENGSLDDLISGLGGGGDDVSLDDLLDSSKQASLSENKQAEVKPVPSSNDSLDLSIFDSEPGMDASENQSSASLGSGESKEIVPEPSPTNETKVVSNDKEASVPAVEDKAEDKAPVKTSADALDEFTAFLASTSSSSSVDNNADKEEERVETSSEMGANTTPVSEAENSDTSAGVDHNESLEGDSSLLFSSESSITNDLLKWCLEQVKEQPSQNGVHVLMRDNEKAIVVERDTGVMEFVRSDYDLDNESAYRTVAEEVLTDLEMSQSWIATEDGGDIWEVIIEGENVNVLLLNIQVPSSYKAVDANSYAWVVKNS